MRSLAAFVLALACACSDAPSTRERASRPAVPEPRHTVRDTRRADAEALVARWLRAQNERDEAAYAALYAQTFSGVRRTPARTFVLDRAGWLADRRRMLTNGARVAIADVAYTITEAAVHVRFVQTFTMGRYADEGTKRLVLVKEHGALVIAVEAMLEATREATSERNPRVVTEGEIVLDDAAHRTAHGAVRSSPLGLVADVPHAPALGDAYTLVRADGSTCEGEIDAVHLHGASFRTFADEVILRRLDPAARDAYLWSIASYRLLAHTDAPCANDAVLAVPAGALPPAVMRSRGLRGPEKNAYAARFAETSLGRRANARFLEELTRARTLAQEDPDVARTHSSLTPEEWAILDRSASPLRGFGGAFDVTVYDTAVPMSFVRYVGRGTCGELFAFSFGALFAEARALDVLPEGFERTTSSVVLLASESAPLALLRTRSGNVLVRLADGDRRARILSDGRLTESECAL